MPSLLTTAASPKASRSRYWHQAIAETYFPLDLLFADAAQFEGELTSWSLGDVSLSRLRAEATCYRRLPRHLSDEEAGSFLVTIPMCAEVEFSQLGKSVRCGAGGFIVERSDEPYEFSHAEATDLWVFKLDAAALGDRIRAPDRFCSVEFDATNGAAGLFTDILRAVPTRYRGLEPEGQAMVGQQLTDLLVLALQSDERTLMSGMSSVREAHLTRIDMFISGALNDPDLDPEMVAAACGISTRYLHALFRDTNKSFGHWVRNRRLLAAREDLCRTQMKIAEIAYRWGFPDQAGFSRAFRTRYGISPKDERMRVRSKL